MADSLNFPPLPPRPGPNDPPLPPRRGPNDPPVREESLVSVGAESERQCESLLTQADDCAEGRARDFDMEACLSDCLMADTRNCATALGGHLRRFLDGTTDDKRADALVGIGKLAYAARMHGNGDAYARDLRSRMANLSPDDFAAINTAMQEMQSTPAGPDPEPDGADTVPVAGEHAPSTPLFEAIMATPLPQQQCAWIALNVLAREARDLSTVVAGGEGTVTLFTALRRDDCLAHLLATLDALCSPPQAQRGAGLLDRVLRKLNSSVEVRPDFESSVGRDRLKRAGNRIESLLKHGDALPVGMAQTSLKNLSDICVTAPLRILAQPQSGGKPFVTFLRQCAAAIQGLLNWRAGDKETLAATVDRLNRRIDAMKMRLVDSATTTMGHVARQLETASSRLLQRRLASSDANTRASARADVDTLIDNLGKLSEYEDYARRTDDQVMPARIGAARDALVTFVLDADTAPRLSSHQWTRLAGMQAISPEMSRVFHHLSRLHGAVDGILTKPTSSARLSAIRDFGNVGKTGLEASLKRAGMEAADVSGWAERVRKAVFRVALQEKCSTTAVRAFFGWLGHTGQPCGEILGSLTAGEAGIQNARSLLKGQVAESLIVASRQWGSDLAWICKEVGLETKPVRAVGVKEWDAAAAALRGGMGLEVGPGDEGRFRLKGLYNAAFPVTTGDFTRNAVATNTACTPAECDALLASFGDETKTIAQAENWKVGDRSYRVNAQFKADLPRVSRMGVAFGDAGKREEVHVTNESVEPFVKRQRTEGAPDAVHSPEFKSAVLQLQAFLDGLMKATTTSEGKHSPRQMMTATHLMGQTLTAEGHRAVVVNCPWEAQTSTPMQNSAKCVHTVDCEKLDNDNVRLSTRFYSRVKGIAVVGREHPVEVDPDFSYTDYTVKCEIRPNGTRARGRNEILYQAVYVERAE